MYIYVGVILYHHNTHFKYISHKNDINNFFRFLFLVVFFFFYILQHHLQPVKFSNKYNFSFAFLSKHVCIFSRFFFVIFYGKEMFLLLIQTSVYGRNIYFKWIFSLILSTYVATLILYPWIDLLFVRICEYVYVLYYIRRLYVLNISTQCKTCLGKHFDSTI